METKMCRVCLKTTASISIFHKQEDMDIPLCAKIMRCTTIVIIENDGLPDVICVNCATELCTSYEFIKKCEASDYLLHSSTKITNIQICVVPKTETQVKLEVDVKLETITSGADGDNTFDNIVSEDHTDNFVYGNKQSKRKYTKMHEYRERYHRRRKPKLKPCDVCGHVAASKQALNAHIRTHTGERPFICPSCDARFNLKGSLKRHILTHNTERQRKYICETCGNGFLTKRSIITHMRVHTDERPYMCPYCPKAFRQITSFIRHKRIHTGERPYPCPICNKNFVCKSQMVRHQDVHSNEKKFSCHLCDISVKTKTTLRMHINTVHSNEKQNICNYCGMTFNSKCGLRNHLKRIHSERSGDCTVCGKSFSDLASHMNKHTGEKPFTCKLCDQGFINKKSLASHVSFRHQNGSKFRCSIDDCVKTFRLARMLEFHLLKHHTNHTPHVCQHCSRGFFRTSDLSRHLKMSHMDTSFKIPRPKDLVQ